MNKKKNNYKYIKLRNRFYSIGYSPWPFFACFPLIIVGIGLALYFNGYKEGPLVSLIGFSLLFYCMALWIRDVIRESIFLEKCSYKVVINYKFMVLLVILSEVLFFVGFFWSFFHNSLVASIASGIVWPPIGTDYINPWGIPLINTVILLISSITITSSHYQLVFQKRNRANTETSNVILLDKEKDPIIFTRSAATEVKKVGGLNFIFFRFIDWFLCEEYSNYSLYKAWFHTNIDNVGEFILVHYRFFLALLTQPTIYRANAVFEDFKLFHRNKYNKSLLFPLLFKRLSTLYNKVSHKCLGSLPNSVLNIKDTAVSFTRALTDSVINHRYNKVTLTVIFTKLNKNLVNLVVYYYSKYSISLKNKLFYISEMRSSYRLFSKERHKIENYEYVRTYDSKINEKINRDLKVTFLLGMLFIITQICEYVESRNSISNGIYHSVFYLLTGFHGIHVIIGVSLIGILLIRCKLGQFGSDDNFVGFDAVVWYWHFVDALWLFILIGLYWWGGTPIQLGGEETVLFKKDLYSSYYQL